jgi:hypothetical protein
VDEPEAWMGQAMADRAAAERLLDGASSEGWCHAIAKYQQSVEKAVKAIVVALRDRGVEKSVGYKHPIEPFVSMLIRLPRAAENRDITSHLSRLLDPSTRAAIHSLEVLIPRKPPPGQPHRRNTEYPFQDPQNRWTFPAAQGIFSSSEVQRFRDLSHRIADGADRIIRTIRRAPR